MKYQLGDEPLGLAVHSLPDPRDVAQTHSLATGRWKLLSIMLVCSIPVIAAYLTYFFLQPQGHAGLGVFISPARPVLERTGVTLDGTTQPLAALKGRWLLVSVTHGDCNEICQRQLFIQRQLRETLGNDKDRVDRVWLIDDQSPVDAALRAAMAGATVLRVAQQDLNSWLAMPEGGALSDYLFVVDPLGNAMMRFPSQVNIAQAGAMRRDLDRLLRATASWTPITR